MHKILIIYIILLLIILAIVIWGGVTNWEFVSRSSPPEYNSLKRNAVLLRGYHYKKNKKGVSSFYSRFGLYDLDYERHFIKTFKNTIMNDTRFKFDYFIITNDSPKLHKLLNDIKPKDYKIANLKKTNQSKSFTDGLELIRNYSIKHKIAYENIIVFRLDLKINKNPMNFIDSNIRNLVSVFKHYKHGPETYSFLDFFHYIPFNILNKYLNLLNETRKTKPPFITCDYTDMPPHSANSKTPKHIAIYNYIQLDKNDCNMLEIDREYAAAAGPEDVKFKKFKWKK